MTGYQLPHWVWPTALTAVCAVVVWRGRGDERLAGAAILVDWMLTTVVYRVTQETQWGLFAVDAAQFAVLLGVALRSPRFWPLATTAFGLLQLLTHLAHAADPATSGWVYITAEIVLSYLLLVPLAYGAWTAPGFAGSPAPTRR